MPHQDAFETVDDCETRVMCGDKGAPLLLHLVGNLLAFARDPEHRIAKPEGRETWYNHRLIRICKVEREYGRPE